jgi:phage head maturation protease
MAVEIIGDPAAVKKYREWLHKKGVYTKRFMDAVKRNGHELASKPEGFRAFQGSIRSVYNQKLEGAKGAVTKSTGLNPEDKLYIAGIANANQIDRMDERLEPSGIDIKNYMRNSVLLVDHLYITSATIGRVIDLKAEDDGVHFEGYIGDPRKAPLTQVQLDTRSLVAQKLIQTVSVGFIPHKIKAPEFDNEGKLLSPAVILNWELLELSVVAVPANPGAVFDLKEQPAPRSKRVYSIPKDLTSEGKQAKISTKQEDSSIVQTLIFSKAEYDEEEAVKWASDHDYRSDNVDETDESYRLRQREQEDFDEESLRTIELDSGVSAVVGQINKDVGEANEMDEKILEMLEEMKRLSTLVASFGDGLKSILEQGEGILGRLDNLAPSKPEDDEKPKEDEDAPPPPPPKEDEEPKDDDEKPKEDKPKDKPKEDEEDKEDAKSLRKMIKDQNEKIERLSGMMLSFIENIDRTTNG